MSMTYLNVRLPSVWYRIIIFFQSFTWQHNSAITLHFIITTRPPVSPFIIYFPANKWNTWLLITKKVENFPSINNLPDPKGLSPIKMCFLGLLFTEQFKFFNCNFIDSSVFPGNWFGYIDMGRYEWSWLGYEALVEHKYHHLLHQ